MIERSDRAKYAKHVFYSSYNDVDIFIEDTAVESKKLYVQIFGRALEFGIKLTQVFPIGAREKVLAACAKDQGDRARGAVYIVDGDFEILTSKSYNLKRLYVLKRYSIENYLVDEDAVVSILNEEVLDQDRDEIKRTLDFDKWLSAISSDLRPLVIAAAVGKHKSCGVKTAKIPLSEITSCEFGLVDKGKIAAKVEEISFATDALHGAGAFHLACRSVSARLSNVDADCLIRHAPGKNLVFPLLKRRVRSVFNFQHGDAALRLRLAMKCSVDELMDIREVLT